jgi:hypothetical protein
MPKPVFVAEYEAAWSTSTTPKSVTASWAAGDVLVVVASSADSAATIGTPTSTGLTFTLAQSIVVTSRCTAYVWTAVPTAAATNQAISVATTANPQLVPWGVNVLRFNSSDGVGASAKANAANAAPSLAITTTNQSSALVVISADWNATDGATRTWRTVNGITPTAANNLEQSYFRDAAQYTVYVAYYDDAGDAASKTVGLSAPSTQNYSIIALEVKGITDTTAPTFTSWVLNADGVTLVGTASEALDPAHVPDLDRLTVKVNGTPRTLTSVAVSGSTATLVLSSAALAGDVLTVSGAP